MAFKLALLALVNTVRAVDTRQLYGLVGFRRRRGLIV